MWTFDDWVKALHKGPMSVFEYAASKGYQQTAEIIGRLIKPVKEQASILTWIMRLKKFFGGGVTYAEWLPEAWGVGTGITGYVKWFLVDWLDNFLYTVVVGENAIAFFFSAFLSLERGEWVGWVWS